MVKSNQDGIFSYSGLTGTGSPNSILPEFNNKSYEFQRNAYFNGLSFGAYLPYYSQIGGQGIFFSVLDKIFPFSPHIKYKIFQAFTSLLTAITISLIILWFNYEFKFLVSLFVLVSTILTPWLVVFGGKLWWSTWSFFMPMVVIMYYLKNRSSGSYKNMTFGILIFFSVLLKCVFTGYEFITTTLIMMIVPFLYYSVLRKITINQFITGFLMTILSAFFAILLSFSILIFQISSIKENNLNGVDHIMNSLEKRSYGDPNKFSPVYSPSLKSDTISVVMTYLEGSFFGPDEFLPNLSPFINQIVKGINYLFLIFFFGILTFILIIGRKNIPTKQEKRAGLALVLAFWFSLLAPLSWFILFKAHSYIHTHMNFIVWHMPFTFFGFAVCGFVIRLLLNIK
jgi:hypothetical protein